MPEVRTSLIKGKPQEDSSISIRKMSKYFNRLEELKIVPNFWCSEEYFEKARFIEQEKEGKLWIEDSDGFVILPELYLNRFVSSPCWCDFEGVSLGGMNKVFLDYEIIYDPKQFLDLTGKRWEVFRKNIRKFPNRNLELQPMSYDRFDEDIMTCVLDWLEDRKEEEIQDDDVLFKYLKEGENRKALKDCNGNVIGINIWDENYHYINYRVAMSRKGDFSNEYLRYLFYTDPEIQGKNKLVNDGGCLGSGALLSFKKKLNPIKIRSVYSWVNEKEKI